MTNSTEVPRPDHIASLTGGYRLPLDPIKNQHISVILDTISRAWQELCMDGLAAITSGVEPEVNALLGSKLNRLRDNNVLWATLVSSVALGRESINHNGTKLEPRPDLTFVLTCRNANFPMVVECKIIDHTNAKTVGLYCNKGIDRFICGHYAWANQEAIMLAYVRDGSTVPSTLVPHLSKIARSSPDPLGTTSHPQARPDVHPTVHHSEHQRNFSYLSVVDGAMPGPIRLFHLWL